MLYRKAAMWCGKSSPSSFLFYFLFSYIVEGSPQWWTKWVNFAESTTACFYMTIWPKSLRVVSDELGMTIIFLGRIWKNWSCWPCHFRPAAQSVERWTPGSESPVRDASALDVRPLTGMACGRWQRPHDQMKSASGVYQSMNWTRLTR